MRSAVGQAGKATDVAANTGSQLGAEAQGVNANLTPFLTSELQHPQGFGQQDTSAMLSAAEGGAGGATSGLTGLAMEQAASSRNAGGFQAALDDAARQRTKAEAGASENIAGQNAQLKQQQMQDAARGMQGMYGADTSGMLDATGQISRDVGAGVEANNSGWLQNSMNVIKTLTGAAKGGG